MRARNKKIWQKSGLSLKEAENEISRFTKEVKQYRLVKSRTITEKEPIKSIWGEDILILFFEASTSTLNYIASCCKKQRNYYRARRMVNNMVVNRLLKSSRSVLSLEDRWMVRINDWIRITKGKKKISMIQRFHIRFSPSYTSSFHIKRQFRPFPFRKRQPWASPHPKSERCLPPNYNLQIQLKPSPQPRKWKLPRLSSPRRWRSKLPRLSSPRRWKSILSRFSSPQNGKWKLPHLSSPRKGKWKRQPPPQFQLPSTTMSVIIPLKRNADKILVSQAVKRKRNQPERCQCVDRIQKIFKRNLESTNIIPITEALSFVSCIELSSNDICNFHVILLARKLQLQKVSLTDTKARIGVIRQNANWDLFLEIFEAHQEWFVEPMMWYTNKKTAGNQMPKLAEKVIVIDDWDSWARRRGGRNVFRLNNWARQLGSIAGLGGGAGT